MLLNCPIIMAGIRVSFPPPFTALESPIAVFQASFPTSFLRELPMNLSKLMAGIRVLYQPISPDNCLSISPIQ